MCDCGSKDQTPNRDSVTNTGLSMRYEARKGSLLFVPLKQLPLGTSPSALTFKATDSVKVVFYGDSGVGKSNLHRRLTGKEFQQFCDSTIGVDFAVVDPKIEARPQVRIQLWDTAGQERYRSVGRAYAHGASCFLLVYDASNPKTLTQTLDDMIMLVKEEHAPDPLASRFFESIALINKQQILLSFLIAKKDAHVVVVANKSDLCPEPPVLVLVPSTDHQVIDNDSKARLESSTSLLSFVVCSAKTGEGIDALKAKLKEIAIYASNDHVVLAS